MKRFDIPYGSPTLAEFLFVDAGIHHLARVIATIEGVNVPGLIVVKSVLENYGHVGLAIMYGPLLGQFLGKDNSPVHPVTKFDYEEIPDIKKLEYAMPIVKEMHGPYINYNQINRHLMEVKFQRVMTPLFYSDDEGELRFFRGEMEKQ